MTRIGAHVKDGSRNGFGEFCEALPSLIVAVGEGGALVDARIKSEGHAIEIYRTVVYNNHPEGVGLNDPDCTKEHAYDVADMFWPLLLEEFEQNPAHYYIVINESGANDPTVVKNYVWYEERCMEHAEVAGLKLCVANLFSGTPDDGSVGGGSPDGGLERWKEWYGPLLKRAYEGGHIYGRHSYGYPDLVPLDHNSDRPFREIEWLKSQGIYIGVALTECGLHGGEYQPSPEKIIEQMAAYDAVMQQYRDMIVGAAWWTYGNWKGAGGPVNLERVSPAITEYVADNYSQAWKPIDYIPPPNGDREPNTIKHTIHLLPQDATEVERMAVVKELMPTNTAFTHSHDVVEATMFHSTPEGKIVAWDPWRWDFEPEEYFSWLGVQYQERAFAELIGGAFRYQVWPVELDPFVTQHWANNPEYYGRFCEDGLCMPGHGGVDMRAPRGTNIRAAAAGRVVRVHRDPDSHNFGIHVYLLHEPHNELTGYCHLLNTEVELDQWVDAGAFIGEADNTGNSFGDHLHFLRKRPGETYGDRHGLWPYNLFDPTVLLRPLAPSLFPPKPPIEPPLGDKVDLMPYFTDGQERGVLYEVQTEYVSDDGNAWRPGPQQRHQTQYENGTIFHTKGCDGPHKEAEWEEIMFDGQNCLRSRDTSPSDDQSQFYELQDVVGVKWSVWCPRHMAQEQSAQRNPDVQFRMKDGCALVAQGRQPSMLVLARIYDSKEFFTGITLEDVIELHWKDLAGNLIEIYFYAKKYGLVGWQNVAKRSAISEIHDPGSRPDSIKEVINC